MILIANEVRLQQPVHRLVTDPFDERLVDIFNGFDLGRTNAIGFFFRNPFGQTIGKPMLTGFFVACLLWIDADPCC